MELEANGWKSETECGTSNYGPLFGKGKERVLWERHMILMTDSISQRGQLACAVCSCCLLWTNNFQATFQHHVEKNDQIGWDNESVLGSLGILRMTT